MKKLGLFILSIIFVFVLSYGGMNYQISKEALGIWFEKLVPSMFGVMVLVKVLFAQGVFHTIARLLGGFLAPLFRIEKEAFAYVITCIFLGFPAGAAFVNEQVKQNQLRKKEGQRLICTCSFATPGFVIMTCGALLFHSAMIGMVLFLIQIFSGMCLLFLTRSTPIIAKSKPMEIAPLMPTLKTALLDSGTTLYMIGGYLMLFMSITAILVQFLPMQVQMPLRIIAEFSSGTMLLSSLSLSPSHLFLLLTMLLSFGGFCVHMQVISMANQTEVSYWQYLFFRLIQVLIASIFAILFLQFYTFS